MTSEQAFSAPHQLQYKTKHSALYIQQQIPTPKLPIAEGNQGEKKAAFIFSMFFILQGAFSSLWTQKRDLHTWSCAVLTGLLLEYERGSQRQGVSVYLCTRALWWVPIIPAVCSPPTHCQTHTQTHTHTYHLLCSSAKSRRACGNSPG